MTALVVSLEEWLPNGAHRILPSSVLGRLLRAATGHP